MFFFFHFTLEIQQAHLISLFITAQNITFFINGVLWRSKHQLYFFLTSNLLNLLNGTLIVPSFLVNTLILFSFAVSFVFPDEAPSLSHFNVQKHHSYFAFSFRTFVGRFQCVYFKIFKRQIHTLYLPCLLTEPKTTNVTFP